MRFGTLTLVVALALAAAATPTSAHHSFAAEYDRDKPLKLTGAVTRIEWMNPHVYFYIDVKDSGTDRVASWAFDAWLSSRSSRSDCSSSRRKKLML